MELEWRRGQCIGHGSFGSVNLAVQATPRGATTKTPPRMAVKSCSASNSASLRHEKEVLTLLRDCPNVIRCFGDDFTCEKGDNLYNVFIEYASGGSLADRIRSLGCVGLPESEVRRHTRSILRALRCIHASGFVHCDVKLQNVLLCSSGHSPHQEGVVAKIADFGLSKRAGTQNRFEIRGTPMSMSPESVSSGEFESPSDVWALGCAVAEMVSGRPAWGCSPGAGVTELLFRICAGKESPEIPAAISEEGRDFLIRCFARDPTERWTAEMLLDHAFVVDLDDDENAARSMGVEEKSTTSPRGPFDFPECVSVHCSLCFSIPATSLATDAKPPQSPSPATRIGQLATDAKSDWSWSESWHTIRCKNQFN